MQRLVLEKRGTYHKVGMYLRFRPADTVIDAGA
jgi:hypothetical protein